MSRTTLSDLTEIGFHARLSQLLPAAHLGHLPIGDDAAALPIGRGRSLVVTTDAVVEGTHFPRGTEPRRVGRLAANVNLSDLASKGAAPLGLLSTLLLSPETETAWAEGVTRGIEEAAARHGIHLVGGDTKRSRERAIAVTAFGSARTRNLMPRTAARPGDLLAVTGVVGRGGAAYLAWKEGVGPRRTSLHRLLDVTPRLAEGKVLGGAAHAAIDTSDGLARSVSLLTAASRVSATIEFDRIPFDPWVGRVASRLEMDEGVVAFLGGDYELLVALPPAALARTQAAIARAGGRLTVIGKVGRRGPNLLVRGGGPLPLPDIGWDAFSRVP